MRLNIYSQELLTNPRGGEPLTGSKRYHDVTELVQQKSNTGVVYSAVRLFLHSSERLHHPPQDDDRSALTFWRPPGPPFQTTSVMERLVRELTIMPSNVNPEKPYRLVLRSHDLSGTDYETLCHLDEQTAREVINLSNGSVGWLYGEPK